MVKKISFLLLAAAILVTGFIALNKLSYWERSVRIFSFNKQEQSFEGRSGRDHTVTESYGERGGRDGFERSGRNELPDSLRVRFEEREEHPFNSNMDIPDSLRARYEPGGGSHRRGEFAGGQKIYLRNVLWFLAVFSLFTVVVIYLDKVYCFVFKSKKGLKSHILKSSDCNEQ